MVQEAAILEEIRNAVTETNRILRIAFGDQLKAALDRAATKAMGGEEDQITNQILNRLLLRSQTAEELSSEIGRQYSISKRTVQRRLEKLVEAGVIKVERRGGSVQYALQMEALA